MDARDVVVIGGGAAGILFTAHLAQAAIGPLRVAVVDGGSSRPGAGVAYATSDPTHLLNVRASGMSAWQDDPQHFVGWLAGVAAGAGRDDFVRRSTYGAYLAAVAYDAGNGPHAQVEHMRCRAVGLSRGNDFWRVRFDGGDILDARAVVLATGVPAPSLHWVPRALRDAPRFIADPWRPGALDEIGPDGRVLVVGTGLTAVDLALSLTREDRPVAMVSRHGWLPAVHTVAPGPAIPVSTARLPTTLAGAREFVAALVAESRAATGDWRPAVDGLRRHTARLWGAWSDAERREFVRTDARRWEVARHRMAPRAAARIAELRDAEQLTVHAADPVAVATRAAAAGIWVVNATGPETDLARGGDPLLRSLLARGVAAPGPLGMGLATDAAGRLLDETGSQVPGLYTLGCTRRGQLWESTAVPEIRDQAAALGRLIATGAARPRARAGVPAATGAHRPGIGAASAEPPAVPAKEADAEGALAVALALMDAGDRAGLVDLHRRAVAERSPEDPIAPLALALVAYLDERYHSAAELLLPLRGRWADAGPDAAAIDDLLIAALTRCGRCGDARLVRAAA